MDAESLRVKYLFSDQATKDRMLIEAMIKVQTLEQRIEIMEARKGVPQELKAMEERAKRPKILS
ncbi:hypothetical protein [Paenibacillus rigui]|uniref:Uncharacterized protein n=1 Tax=Paenibacillus rigui TaxID=554312 RepID=A0A229UKS3_9BACL|nr:hypothetical protein [Paenibacillus rigui]OXM83982.1 hypothetical protein CF651_22995 [Paenibacillus rigui]